MVTELANEDAKYTASHQERIKAIDKLKAEVVLLETALLANQARLKENNLLHNIQMSNSYALVAHFFNCGKM